MSDDTCQRAEVDITEGREAADLEQHIRKAIPTSFFLLRRGSGAAVDDLWSRIMAKSYGVPEISYAYWLIHGGKSVLEASETIRRGQRRY